MPVPESELLKFKDFALELSFESGKIIKKYFKKSYSVELKQDLSPVTIADREAECKMREMIGIVFPNHGIVGEEFGNFNGTAEYKWILDPIDGTKSFVCGAFSFGTLIALTKNDEPILGIINQPILGELYYGDNISAELNGKKIKIRQTENLEDAVLLATDHLNFEKYQDAAKFSKLIHTVKLYRNWGDCYGYALVASGFADIMIDPIMNLWDLCALIPIIRGAGGTITDYFGRNPMFGSSIIATNSFLHAKVLNILR